ncbi:SMP-30/gluconolactonase/LRE family protein [Lentimicrobium sp. S6]|uniref:SMP-30/gluconolactonase/LRE family protein n=1 Tax=Lentimicrobium sp. S6 TaxID=2735872 RepID=UPI0015572FBD|nr:SMP-30/gluconolactonase/LRE family protein [Lentimicrobium sp. S6]NPD47279.1 hypothetical protein [Lentimicrobium sp. S6]
MKNNSTLLCSIMIAVLIFISCNQKKQEQENKKNNIAYRITEKDLIPEGITYSQSTNSFYVSSVKKTKIIQLNAETGKFKDFIPSDLLEMRFLGMITDESRNHLWACGNLDKNNMSYSTIAKFDLNTGELLKSYLHIDSIRFIYNDLVLDNDGNIYATNSSGMSIYRIDQQTDSINLFFEGAEIERPNGITISPDNKYLYIASNTKGIRILDIENHKTINHTDSSLMSTGIDGLKYYKNSLIGIQNSFEDQSKTKICKYFLDDKGTSITNMKILDQNNPHFDIPTTFVINSNHIYCLANSQLGNIDYTTFEIVDLEKLNDVLILKYKLN